MAFPARSVALNVQPDEVLRVLGELRPGTTMCPGKLARRLGTEPAALRPLLLRLAAEERIRISQGGRPSDPATLRGPYRVASARR